MARKYYDCSYRITLKNGSTTDFNDIKLEYVIYYTQENHIHSNSDKKEDHGTLYISKTTNLPKKSTKEIETESLLLYTYGESGYNDNWPDLQSEVQGIILNLSIKSETGETISRRLKFPEKLNHVWTPRTKDVQRRPSN